MFKRLSIFIVLFFFLFSTTSWAVSEDPQQDLEQINQRIAEKRKEISGILKKESSILSNLRRVEQGLISSRKEISLLRAKKKKLLKQKKENQQRILILKDKEQRAKRVLADLFRSLYQQGASGYLGYLLRANSIGQLLARKNIVKQVIANCQQTSLQLDADILAIKEEQRRADLTLAQLNDIGRELSRSQNRFNDERQRKQILLNLVNQQKDFYLRSIKEMEAASANLQQLIGRLDQRRTVDDQTIDLSRLKGRLPAPLKSWKVGKSFGKYFDKRLRSFVRFKGIEFKVAEGSEVYSVASGKVVFAGWFEGYGQMVVVDHGNGYLTLYGNLRSIRTKINNRVQAGELLALSGSTGSLNGPKLYFELRQKGRAQNPKRWLNIP